MLDDLCSAQEEGAVVCMHFTLIMYLDSKESVTVVDLGDECKKAVQFNTQTHLIQTNLM